MTRKLPELSRTAILNSMTIEQAKKNKHHGYFVALELPQPYTIEQYEAYMDVVGRELDGCEECDPFGDSQDCVCDGGRNS